MYGQFVRVKMKNPNINLRLECGQWTIVDKKEFN